MRHQVDINCDIGESWREHVVGNDESVYSFVSSYNIACGLHGGDPMTMQKTINKAIENEATIGAHISYPDRKNFGRTPMSLREDELTAIIQSQLITLKGMVQLRNGRLQYVKPHGALYHKVNVDEQTANVVLDAISSIDNELAIMVQYGSVIQKVAEQRNISVIREGFLDRRYDDAFTLKSRSKKDAVITDPKEVIAQFHQFLDNQVVTESGSVDVQVDSLCIHGDNPNIEEIITAITTFVKNKNIQLSSPL